jgi:hypothetical protein
VCERGGAGVWDRVGDTGVAGVEGRDDMEADRPCMEVNREIGVVAGGIGDVQGVGAGVVGDMGR